MELVGGGSGAFPRWAGSFPVEEEGAASWARLGFSVPAGVGGVNGGLAAGGGGETQRPLRGRTVLYFLGYFCVSQWHVWSQT